MSGICGWVGDAHPRVLDAMLAAIDYRGDRTDTVHGQGFALGYRWWGDRPGKAPGIYHDGRYGSRIEDIVVCGEHGPDVLNQSDRDLWVVNG